MAAPLNAIYTGDKGSPIIPEARSPRPRKVAGREAWDGFGRMGIPGGGGGNFAISEVLLDYPYSERLFAPATPRGVLKTFLSLTKN